MDSPHGAAVKAEDFGLKGPRGWAFRGVGIDAAPGSLIAVEGPSGSGRTCLLLALTGRMKATRGHAEIGGHRLPKRMAAVRRIAALGPVPGVNDLDQSLTVAEQLREGALLQRRYDAPVRALLKPRAERRAGAAARIDAALAAAGLDLDTLPKGARTSVRDLERLEAVRLSVAIALLGSPRLLALDDLDLKLSDTERTEAWTLLRSIAAGGTTVLAVCSEAPADAVVLRTCLKESDGPDEPATAPPAPRGDAADARKVTWGTSTKSDPDVDADADADADADQGPDDDADADADGEDVTGTEGDTGTDDADADAEDTSTDTDTDTENDDTKGADDALAEAGRA
ncbi:ATP-binding cassette domain-containing protein [Streptomyces sp. NBC_01294]|uniref:ATP-binding cassette domain-containing protein n=1 Tax=Streptomyces sp. NBC_01294 TaxID=2903815 RepID=UPI002DD7E883|nr:ATP-binding cassette domain-containing protein [Streptomyces sp. NBC_01294]WRZ59808.1 ATP-binding cassette domain-containing protein [Streptomyces sp. NBC_01294]